MIITTGGIKGGSGKTTLAVSLTVLLSHLPTANDVLLVDADNQATASDFSTWRTESLGQTGYTSIKLSGVSVRNEVQKLKKKYDHIVIDAGGRDTASQRAAIAVSDIYLVPFAPKSFDMWTLEQVTELVKEMGIVNPDLKSYAVLNKVDYNQKDIDEARNYIEEAEIFKVLDNTLHERKAFANAAAEGLTVSEYKPYNKKAIAELESLFKEIISVSEKPLQYVA